MTTLDSAPFDIRLIDWPADWDWSDEPRWALACYLHGEAAPLWWSSVPSRWLHAFVGDGTVHETEATGG